MELSYEPDLEVLSEDYFEPQGFQPQGFEQGIPNAALMPPGLAGCGCDCEEPPQIPVRQDNFKQVWTSGLLVPGPQGLVGPPGPIGPRGYPGQQGVQGIQGIQGVRGVEGQQGLVGPQGQVGPRGAQGMQGQRGPQGLPGVPGSPGVAGPPGAPGPQGDPGPIGEGLKIDGSVADPSLLPPTATDGEVYFSESDEHLYLYMGGNWIDMGSFVGPEGPQGLTGPQGIPGPQGAPGPQGDSMWTQVAGGIEYSGGFVNLVGPTGTSWMINGVPFASAGSINLVNINKIVPVQTPTPQPLAIDGDVDVDGDIDITGQYLVNGVPLVTGLSVFHAGTQVGTIARPTINFTDTATATFNIADDTPNNRFNISVTAIAAGALADPTTTLGDLIVRGLTAPPTRLGIGTDGQVLTADSGQTLGMHWATPTPAPVTSVFSRTGAIVAQSGDYNATLITLQPDINSWGTVQNAISSMNSSISLLTRGMAYVGYYDAAADDAQFVPSMSTLNGPLPAANAAGLEEGDYLVVTSATAGPPALNVGDQLISGGSTGPATWTILPIGHNLASVTASMVTLSPDINSWGTVQGALGAINTFMTNTVSSQWVSGAGGVISYSGGNVGIGNAAPAYTLDITGNLNITGNFSVGGIIFAQPGSVNLHVTSIAGIDGAPIKIASKISVHDMEIDLEDMARGITALNERMLRMESRK